MLICTRESIKIGSILSCKFSGFIVLCLSRGLGMRITEMILLCYYNAFTIQLGNYALYTHFLVIQAV